MNRVQLQVRRLGGGLYEEPPFWVVVRSAPNADSKFFTYLNNYGNWEHITAEGFWGRVARFGEQQAHAVVIGYTQALQDAVASIPTLGQV